PMLNVFVKRDGKVRHFYATELFFVKPEPGRSATHRFDLAALEPLRPHPRGAGRGLVSAPELLDSTRCRSREAPQMASREVPEHGGVPREEEVLFDQTG